MVGGARGDQVVSGEQHSDGDVAVVELSSRCSAGVAVITADVVVSEYMVDVVHTGGIDDGDDSAGGGAAQEWR